MEERRNANITGMIFNRKKRNPSKPDKPEYLGSAVSRSRPNISFSVRIVQPAGMAAAKTVLPSAKDGLLLAAGLAMKICEDGEFTGTTWETVVSTLYHASPSFLSRQYGPEEVSQSLLLPLAALMTADVFALTTCGRSVEHSVRRSSGRSVKKTSRSALSLSSRDSRSSASLAFGLTRDSCVHLLRYIKSNHRAIARRNGGALTQTADVRAAKKAFALDFVTKIVKRFVLKVIGSRIGGPNGTKGVYGESAHHDNETVDQLLHFTRLDEVLKMERIGGHPSWGIESWYALPFSPCFRTACVYAAPLPTCAPRALHTGLVHQVCMLRLVQVDRELVRVHRVPVHRRSRD